MRAEIIRLALCLALVLPAGAVPAPALAQGNCLSSGQQAAEVRSGRVVRPGDVGRSLGGNVLRMELCRSNGGLVWNVTVLRPDGRVEDRRVDARTGRVLR
jgi:hypothetical protein